RDWSSDVCSSDLLKTLVSGMDKDKSVLLLQDDYPSLSFPFYSSGLKVKTIEITADLEDRILQEFNDNTPDVFAFSLVQYISGIKLDLNFINSLKKQYPRSEEHTSELQSREK